MDKLIESFHSSINDSDVDENAGDVEGGEEGEADVTVLDFVPLLVVEDDPRRRLLLVLLLLFLLLLDLLPLVLDLFFFLAVYPRITASFLLAVEGAAFVLGEVGV